jgi:capsular polysaccharide biosynthesis protein
VDDVERATLALAGSKEPKEHGQLCPVWTQRLKKVRHAATIADCDCWVLPTARLDARIVIAALGSPSTEDDRPSYPDHADMSCDER